MSDPTTPTAATPTANAPKHHGLLDKHQLAEISLANTIYGVASDPAIFPKLQDTLVITPAFMTQLGTDLAGMSQYTGNVTQAKTEAELDTGSESSAKKTLLTQIHYIQSKAKLKYAGNKGVLPEYGIGVNITLSRAVLETAAGNIINKLKSDTLPKITAQHGTNLQAALTAYQQSKITQVTGKGDATTQHHKLSAMVESLAVRRRQLQHAADGEFPYNDPASAGMRSKFSLPPDHPLNP